MAQLCPCGAQPDRSQVLADEPLKRKCVTCDKIYDAPNPEHAATARPARVVEKLDEEPTPA